MTGKIKTVLPKGFGFIVKEGQEKEVFFHMNSLVGIKFEDLQPGDEVSFDEENGDKGVSAVNVQRA